MKKYKVSVTQWGTYQRNQVLIVEANTEKEARQIFRDTEDDDAFKEQYLDLECDDSDISIKEIES